MSVLSQILSIKYLFQEHKTLTIEKTNKTIYKQTSSLSKRAGITIRK